MKTMLYHVAAAVALLGWMMVIFSFSAQPAVESSQVSGGFSYRLVRAVNETFRLNLNEKEIKADAARIEYPVRKAAHMTEYAIMGLLCFAFYTTWNFRGKKCYIASFLTAVCYAGTDEFHQIFVPGRSGRVSDVCVDAIGVLIGLLFLMLLIKIVRKHCEKEIHPIQ